MTENARTLEGAEALSTGDVTGFGLLMDQSHRSLRDDFDVCPPAIDAIATAVRFCPGLLRALVDRRRFGGCAVALVESEAVEDVRRAARKLGSTVYECRPATGVENITSALPSTGSCAGGRIDHMTR